MKKLKFYYFYKRLLIYIIGICIMAVGVVFSIKADLGTAPITSIPYVTALITGYSVGLTTIVINVLTVFLEIAILRKKFQLFQLLQIPVTFGFGFVIDIAGKNLQTLNYANYCEQWLFCFIGLFLIAIGVNMEIYANLVPMPGEGIVLAICEVTPIQFSNMKIILDVSYVVTACALSFFYLESLQGVREGTIAAALLVGYIVKFINKKFF